MSENGDAGRGVLLYVEDDPRIAEMTIEVLSEAYDVEHAATGEAALRLALNGRYDVMVVDRRLPGMDGVEFIRAVRTARITTPILMLTALGSVDDRVSGLDGGANDYLVKPFDYDELLARLRSLRRGFRADGVRRRLGDWSFTPDVAGCCTTRAGTAWPSPRPRALCSNCSAAAPSTSSAARRSSSAVFREGETTSSVDTYVHYVRRKSTRDMIETVRARGYRAGNPS